MINERKSTKMKMKFDILHRRVHHSRLIYNDGWVVVTRRSLPLLRSHFDSSNPNCFTHDNHFIFFECISKLISNKNLFSIWKTCIHTNRRALSALNSLAIGSTTRAKIYVKRPRPDINCGTCISNLIQGTGREWSFGMHFNNMNSKYHRDNNLQQLQIWKFFIIMISNSCVCFEPEWDVLYLNCCVYEVSLRLIHQAHFRSDTRYLMLYKLKHDSVMLQHQQQQQQSGPGTRDKNWDFNHFTIVWLIAFNSESEKLEWKKEKRVHALTEDGGPDCCVRPSVSGRVGGVGTEVEKRERN